MDLNHLRTFALVARHGAMAAAARTLGVPTSTVSRHLTRLEAALGVDLVHRGSRRITLTDAGAELLRLSAAPLSELEHVAEALPFGEPRGVLRVSAPSHLANADWFADLLVHYRSEFPAVVIDVNVGSWRADPIAEGIDIAFRPAGTLPDTPDLIARRLPALELGLYASPRYLQATAMPVTVESLAQHDMVTARHLLGQPLVLLYRGRRTEVVPRSMVIGDDLAFVLALAVAGAGFAPMPHAAVADRVASGALVPILEGYQLPALEPAIVWPRRRFGVPRVRAFVDLASQQLPSIASLDRS